MARNSSAKKLLGSKYFLVFLVVAAILITFNVGRAYYQDYKIRQEITSLKEEVKKMEQKKLESLKILQYVSSDAFVEEKARTELNLKKPEENVMFVDTNTKDNSTNITKQKTTLNNPTKWWYYITRHSLPE